ncbi:MAG: NAD(P)-dependent oxidoreductase [Chromatiales bacterium]|nr:NAD(P)-dependent oxidoreductase [Chromatiales bacterium]
MKTGVIGLGAMGRGMAANLARAGLLAGVWNRTADKAAAFAAEHGVAQAGTPAELARQSDALVVCVSADADVLEMVDALLPGAHAGQIVFDCSTVASETAVEAARRLASAGVAFADAPVSGGVEGARNATMVMMVGAAAETFERLRPVFAAISKSATHMGPVGAGQATKAVNQVMVGGINEGVTEALAFGARLGLPLERLIEVIGGGAAGNWFLSHRGPGMARGEFPPGFKLALHLKDLRICAQMAEAAGTELPLVAATIGHYEQLVSAGHGDEDISALYRLKRP